MGYLIEALILIPVVFIGAMFVFRNNPGWLYPGKKGKEKLKKLLR